VFEDIIKKLNKLKEHGISIPIESDEKGYLDRQCPFEGCEFLFKIHQNDWKTVEKKQTIWCPLCRHEAPADQWFSIAQVEHARKQAVALVNGEIHDALVSDAQRFNRKQPRNNFISMTMKIQGGHVQTSVIPAAAVDQMRLEISCEKCNAQFAVIGNAFFCPLCGHNSVTNTYADSLRKIRVKRDSIDVVRRALIQTTGKDEAELTCRSLLETCITDGVVAFQKFCEGLYIPYGIAPSNAFQRLDQGSELWKKAIGIGYDDWLEQIELDGLKILYQKRHLLAHSEGIVDGQYLKKSGDGTYKEGQRIVVSANDIDELTNYLDRLGNGLKAACTKP
jgi:Zn finger protein HypA/HybF involved in hydrogenase expression